MPGATVDGVDARERVLAPRRTTGSVGARSATAVGVFHANIAVEDAVDWLGPAAMGGVAAGLGVTAIAILRAERLGRSAVESAAGSAVADSRATVAIGLTHVAVSGAEVAAAAQSVTPTGCVAAVGGLFAELAFTRAGEPAASEHSVVAR